MKRRSISICRVLHVDLGGKNSRVETFEGGFLKSLIGGRGITSYLLYRDVPKGTDPLSAENILAFTSGVLGGTNAPSAARTTVTSKSPVTGLFMKASMGGQWGANLRFAGYDVLVLHGKSDSWVNVIVTDQGVSFEPADKYLGKSVLDTTELIAEDHPDLPDLSVCCVGIAGEKHIAYAGIFGSVYNTAARGGMGAVMGFKRVKAVCCSGRTALAMSDADRYMAAVEEGLASVKSIGRCAYYKEYGTVGGMIGLNESGSLPVRNFQLGYMEDVHRISGQAMTNDGYLVRRDSCFACPISCKRFTKTLAAYQGTQSGGPEYETLSVFGAGCEVADMDACIRANYLVNYYGLDSISCGAAIQWAMETAEKGLLPATFQDPATGITYNLKFGDADAMLILIEMIADRRGIGDLLALGVREAARLVGGDSWKWAVEAKGLEQSRVETRFAKAYALAFATNPRGPDHLYGQPMAEFGFSPEMKAVIRRITGDAKYAVPTATEKKAEIVAWHEEVYAMTDSLGLCSRATLSTYAITPANMAKLYSAAMGSETSEDELFQAARRIIHLERMFNVREGVGKEADALPWRLMHEPLKRKNGDVGMNSPEEMGNMLERYYEIRGWDRSGRPEWNTLAMNGLDAVTARKDLEHGH